MFSNVLSFAADDYKNRFIKIKKVTETFDDKMILSISQKIKNNSILSKKMESLPQSTNSQDKLKSLLKIIDIQNKEEVESLELLYGQVLINSIVNL